VAQLGTRPAVRAIHPGEALALYRGAIHSRPEGFFWLWSPPARQNERIGDVAVVHVRGPLEHHADSWGDSYGAIVKRVERAIKGEDVCEEWDRKDRWGEAEGERPEPCPPSTVVLKIDSPGGVVSGLNEATAKLARVAKDSGIKLVAYVDEMAASAAYCIACACSEIYAPRSAILGSIGVISTMVDQTAADAEAGLRFVTITSGERKSDGHPHVEIDAEAVAAERGRVMQLAGQFWEIVSKARGLSVGKIEGYEAGIFLGKEARKAGLADKVLGWDTLLKRLGALPAEKPGIDKRSLGKTSSVAQSGTRGTRASERAFAMDLAALIKKTKAAIATEDDPAKLAALAADLAAYKKTEKHVEHTKTEEGDDDEEDEESEESEAKGNETDRNDDEKDDEDDDEEGDDDAKKTKKSKKSSKAEGSEEEKKATLAVYQVACEATGKSGRAVAGALAALVAEAKELPELRKRVAKIEQDKRIDKRSSLIATAKAERRITPHEAKTLATKKLDFVQDFLDMRPNALVATDDGELLKPSGKENADLPPFALAEINGALAALPEGTTKEAREAMRERLIANARKAIAETNGAAVGRH